MQITLELQITLNFFFTTIKRLWEKFFHVNNVSQKDTWTRRRIFTLELEFQEFKSLQISVKNYTWITNYKLPVYELLLFTIIVTVRKKIVNQRGETRKQEYPPPNSNNLQELSPAWKTRRSVGVVWRTGRRGNRHPLLNNKCYHRGVAEDATGPLAINRAFPFEGNLFRVAVGIQLSKQNNTLRPRRRGRRVGMIRGPIWRQGPREGEGPHLKV